MKILTLCAGGNTRSVTLATILKYRCRGKHDVLSASVEKNTDFTLMMLSRWADRILIADWDLYEEFHKLLGRIGYDGDTYIHIISKVEVADLGKDMWGMSMHPDLVPLACKVLADLGFELKAGAEEIIKHREKYDNRRKEAQPYDNSTD